MTGKMFSEVTLIEPVFIEKLFFCLITYLIDLLNFGARFASALIHYKGRAKPFCHAKMSI
ncbi:MAG: hypothetical protein J6Y99_10040, partial [Bacteroidales bacterium]|nr:hypothetical protein [Bacteroidales bacterium]